MTFLLSLKSGSFTVPFRRIHSWVIFVLKSCVTVAKYLSMEKWIKKMWYIYSAMRKKEILPFVNNIDEPWGHYAKWNKPDTTGQIINNILFHLHKAPASILSVLQGPFQMALLLRTLLFSGSPLPSLLPPRGCGLLLL